ncbi:MAG TPA: cytochrome P450 [Streptosporangiaceae bacterium]|nr:cytochrome P450 [Streptosporangiaceae bacterium]
MTRSPGDFPLGAGVRLEDLAGPGLHRVLARLRVAEPVSWLPVLGGWLVTRYDLATRVLRDSASFTVDDPRFSTARVVGPSMLSLDGAAHDRHRRPFSGPFSPAQVRGRLAGFVTAEAGRLVAGLRPDGQAELRRGLAGPLATVVVARMLGLAETPPGVILGWYDAIVAAVSGLAAAPGAGPAAAGAAAFGGLAERVRTVITAGDAGESLLAAAVAGPAGRSAAALSSTEAVSNAAVLMFGGIETAEGMITNAAWHLLSHPGQLRLVREDPGLLANAIEESLRLEPAAAVVDRYATRDIALGGAAIRPGDLVTVSLAGAGRDPAMFSEPDRFSVRRDNASRHLAFARGPHFCLGVHLARLEAQAALGAMLQLPGVALEPGQPAPQGLVFRKPARLAVRWPVPVESAHISAK